MVQYKNNSTIRNQIPDTTGTNGWWFFYARVIGRRFKCQGMMPFPLQTQFLATLKAAALAQGRADLINFWAGQNTAGLKHHKAGVLMQSLVEETTILLR